MKKLIFLLLLFSAPAFAQYSLKIALPTTGLSSVIKFAKYPHNDLGADEVTGITVTEPGSAKTYLAVGFTTYQYVTLWINGVKQTWFDSVQVGNPATVFGRLGSANTWLLSNAFYYPYISSSSPLYSDYGHAQFFGSTLIWKDYANAKYGQLTASNTWSGTTNQFEGALFGDNVTFEGTTIGSDYTYDMNSNLYLRVTQPSNNTVIWKRYLTDNYLDTSFLFWDGSKLRLGLGKGPLYGRTNTQPPINVNTNHFEYSGDQLSLKYALNFDSATIKKDTIIGEATYSKLWSIKRRFFSQIDSHDVRVYYKNTYPGTSDSMYLLNVAYQSSNNTSTGLSGSTWVFADTITVPTFGTWQITYSAVCVFPAATGSDAYDSIFVDMGTGTGADKQLAGSETYITHWYDNAAQTGGSQTVTWSFVYHTTSDNRTLFLRGKNSTAAVGTMYINRSNVTYTRIK